MTAALHTRALAVLAPSQGPFEWTALSAPLAIPRMGLPAQCLEAADVTPRHVQSPEAGREDDLLPMTAPALPS